VEAGLACGGAIGLGLRRALRSPAALVLHWSAASRPEAVPRVPALPGARRLVTALRGRGHQAWGSGRLAFVALPDDPQEAEVAAGRAIAAAGPAPCVLVVAGPRPAQVESLLEIQDGVAVVTRDGDGGELAALAVAGLAQRGLNTSAIDVPRSGLARLGATTGLWLTPRARRVVDSAFGAPQ